MEVVTRCLKTVETPEITETPCFSLIHVAL
jgi:hypothetical protein